MRRSRVDELGQIIIEAMEEYADHTAESTKKAVKKAGADTAKELKKTSPKKTGKYAKSWKSKVISENSTSVQVVVYASGTEGSISHLLENGHAKRNGGRVSGIPHIRPAQEGVEEKIMKELEKDL